jgi:hypothetical protein
MTAIDVLHACFWGVLAAYIIHILDETLMNGGFTQKVKEHWWPDRRRALFIFPANCHHAGRISQKKGQTLIHPHRLHIFPFKSQINRSFPIRPRPMPGVLRNRKQLTRK